MIALERGDFSADQTPQIRKHANNKPKIQSLEKDIIVDRERADYFVAGINRTGKQEIY